MSANSPIRESPATRVFQPLLGQPCWGVQPGLGSFLTLEFGRPSLVIREPVESHASSARLRRHFARRLVYPRGQWHLWIYCCDWQVRKGGRVVGDSSTRRRVEASARALDGQRLVNVSLARRGAVTRFAFDLGAVLETRPYNRRGGQWMLFMPDRKVLTLRADRRYTLHRADCPPSKAKWRAA